MMSTLPGQSSNQAMNDLNNEGSGDDESGGDDYYGNFARRVYFLADVEGWEQKKIMHYFNDKQSFEKYYTNWQKK